MVENDDLDYDFDSSDPEVIETVTTPIQVIDNEGEIILGEAASNVVDGEDLDMDALLESNLRIGKILNKIIDERMGTVSSMVSEKLAEMQNGENQRRSSSTGENVEGNIRVRVASKEVVKSPLDTTIYVPALRQKFDTEQVGQHLSNLNRQNAEQAVIQQSPAVINAISNFVESIRRDSGHKAGNQDARETEVDQLEMHPLTSRVPPPQFNQVKNRADDAIIEAERMRATLNEIPGRSFDNQFVTVPTCIPMNEQGRLDLFKDGRRGNGEIGGGDPQSMQLQNFPDIGSGVSDDDSFHLTCHIEPSLIHKIEKGEFVELDKLLPKLGGFKGDDNRLEWVQHDGGTYLVPASRDNKITSIRRWEQAFRAYATIYCGTNPHQSKEIWQYISVINTVAASYSWDKVYNYDITFRHLMAFNPSHSWAVTYNQMWNLSMRDPLPKHSHNAGQRFNNSSYSGHATNKGVGSTNSASGSKKKKPDYCWNFNKGIKCKFGKGCKFIERCSFWDLPNHGIHVCPKAASKNEVKVNQGAGSSGGAHAASQEKN